MRRCPRLPRRGLAGASAPPLQRKSEVHCEQGAAPDPRPARGLARALPSGGAMRRAKQRVELRAGGAAPDPAPPGAWQGLALRAGLL